MTNSTSYQLRKSFAYLFTLFTYVAYASFIPPSNNTDTSGDAKVIVTTTRGLEYMYRNRGKVNLDAAIGTRIVEGQLSVMLSHFQGDQRYDDLYYSVRRLRDLARQVSDSMIPLLRNNQRSYFNKIGGIVMPFTWMLDYPDSSLELYNDSRRKGVWPKHAQDTPLQFNEADSDNCVSQLLGVKTRKCYISKKCAELIANNGQKGYSLTHQIFFLQIGEMLDCFNEPQLRRLRRHQGNLCSRIFTEAQLISNSGFYQPQQDLFMEQIGLCGIYGYFEFARDPVWLEKVISWQTSSGCWPLGDVEISRTGMSLRREKREEKLLDNRCGSHKTAVALASLVQFLRYQIF